MSVFQHDEIHDRRGMICDHENSCYRGIFYLCWSYRISLMEAPCRLYEAAGVVEARNSSMPNDALRPDDTSHGRFASCLRIPRTMTISYCRRIGRMSTNRRTTMNTSGNHRLRYLLPAKSNLTFFPRFSLPHYHSRISLSRVFFLTLFLSINQSRVFIQIHFGRKSRYSFFFLFFF